jgi:hypothetical protein
MFKKATLLDFKAVVRKVVNHKGELPKLVEGLCNFFDARLGYQGGPGAYNVMDHMDRDLYYSHLGPFGEWTEHRLNVLAFIDNLTNKEWLAMFEGQIKDETTKPTEPTPSQEPTAGTQDPS